MSRKRSTRFVVYPKKLLLSIAGLNVNQTADNFDYTAVALDPPLDIDDDMQLPMYRGGNKHISVADVCKQTGLSPAQVKFLYRGYKQECPSGLATEADFIRIYRQCFPKSTNDDYAKRSFRAMRTSDDATEIRFVDLLNLLVRLRQCSGEQKVRWTFRLVDQHHSGRVSQTEFIDFIASIHALNGTPFDNHATRWPSTQSQTESSESGGSVQQQSLKPTAGQYGGIQSLFIVAGGFANIASRISRDSELGNGAQEQDPNIIAKMLFKQLDQDGDGYITEDDYVSQLANPEKSEEMDNLLPLFLSGR